MSRERFAALCHFDGLQGHSPVLAQKSIKQKLDDFSRNKDLKANDKKTQNNSQLDLPKIAPIQVEHNPQAVVKTVRIKQTDSPGKITARRMRTARKLNAEPEHPFISSVGPWIPPADMAMIDERIAQSRSIHPQRFKPGGNGRDAEHQRDLSVAGFYSSGNVYPESMPASQKRFGSYMTVHHYQFRDVDVSMRWGSFKKNLYLGYKGW